MSEKSYIDSAALAAQMRSIRKQHSSSRAVQREKDILDLYGWLSGLLLAEAQKERYKITIKYVPGMEAFTLVQDGSPITSESLPFYDVDEPDVLLMLRDKFQPPDFDLLLGKDGEQSTARSFIIKLM